MNIKKISNIVQKNSHLLHSEFSVEALHIFGSVALGKATAKSDVDILVAFKTDDIGMIGFMRLKFFLESILKTKVDLVTYDAIRPDMVAQIGKDSIRVA